ncbi:phospholipase D/nuclease [Lepidopterella palustris CBS 459.81]|uniref:Phospholipase n=1 Tax=Lepidopterella palustris CBS 459.81 TaxID=1314670 RepID=A0A8E2E7V5_9PEZI|nr:phospholipase D/nuclease [Lepidopterella palustris CBS 459.81]
MSFLFDKMQSAVNTIGSEIKGIISSPGYTHSHTHDSGVCSDGTHDDHAGRRYLSFAPERHGNDVKWYVDGCGYMWAVSIALERAKKSIWILDWWLSPELYLRRPPAKNQQYRLDKMLEAAAQRGVKVNIIVYKEVTQALTLSSSHTKHTLENLHPNISVFRHPDHLPDRQTLQTSFISSLQNMSFSASALSQLPGDSLKAIYGMNEDTVLYWAHHEKLCLVDGSIAFMGGLDLCYGRWDTNQHFIADAHPGDLDRIVFPGQDYNNARIMDFQDVANWQNNKLDRTKSSRMGWSDISLCLTGPVVEDLKTHFLQRWNFIYDEKYTVRNDVRYSRLALTGPPSGPRSDGPYSAQQLGQDDGNAAQGQYYPPPPTQQYRDFEEGETDRGFRAEEYDWQGEGGRGPRRHGDHRGGLRDKIRERVGERMQQIEQRYGQPGGHHHGQLGGHHHSEQQPQGGVACQITRSCDKWSHGVSIEHSIANAYIEVIRNSEHFVYIENQFFITATCDEQKPIKNKIAAAIVERIIRAARNMEKYKMIVMIPAIPGFAGNLKSDDALATRAIMEFQYNSINRGGHSIYETIARAGFNPMEYIRFYNLRNYDRINASGAMREAEQQSGVSYGEARQEHDVAFGGDYQSESKDNYQSYRPPPAEYLGQEPAPLYEMDAGYGQTSGQPRPNAYQQYQQGAAKIGSVMSKGQWDTVSACYMLGGPDIREVPWEGGAMDEIDAFVSEELYIHSKVLIADDRVVICGSANLNDRSQLGNHDSEIAVIIEDPSPVESYMDGRPWRASKFAASLRRQLFRKHLGLLKPQIMDQPDQNFEPIGVPNSYDWNSPEDLQVADPLSDDFQILWNYRAKTNTDAFAKVFHSVPYDGIRTWKQYEDYYERYFHEDEKDKANKKPSLYKWGHVVAEDFSPGEQGLREVKEVLSTIKGTLVEMPLLFLKDEDIAKEGLGLNAFTEEVYT